MGKQYIHYGTTHFEKDRFSPIENRPFWAKPKGGFWASMVDAQFGWKEWCADSGFADLSAQPSFRFSLLESARVLQINTVGDLSPLPERQDMVEFYGGMGLSDNFRSVYLDFELLRKQGVDAVETTISNDSRLYHMLYGWDCDSILIMNPDIVIAETKK